MKNIQFKMDKIHNKRTPLDGAEYYEVISKKMKDIHSQIPEQSFNLSKIASTDIREEYLEGKNCKRLVMYLMSNGCEWALKSGNGCTICGHLAKQTRKDKIISCKNYITQFEKEFKKYDFKDYPILNLYNNGSFFNDNEIPAEARREILKSINKEKNIKMLVLETRPEFVTEDKIREVKELIPDKIVEIAIGLEVYEDKYRYLCLNKGFSLLQYKRAAEIIKKKLNLRTYVMLKPPFLTEKESIDQAIKTIEFAFSIGADTISLETCTIQEYTLISHLSSSKNYSTAWLWSIIEVVKSTAHLGKLVIGMFQFYPSAEKVPYNCKKCSNKILERLIQYNRSLNTECLDNIYCECKSEWEKLFDEEAIPLETRVKKFLA